MENIIKGYKYEVFIHSIIPNSFLWKFIPYKYLTKSGLIHNLNQHRLNKIKDLKNNKEFHNTLIDTGVDLLQYIKETKEYIFIQCKNYSHNVGINDLSGFFFMCSMYNKKGKLYITSNPTKNLKENWINLSYQYFIQPLPQISSQETIQYNLYDYQSDAVSHIQKYFENHNRGILSMPCGTGKTIIASYVSRNYKNLIFMSPLIQFTDQIYDRFNNYNPDLYKMLKIYTNNRDMEHIKSFINENDKLFIAMCYGSIDLIFDILELMNSVEDTLIIIDEFHNISKNSLINKEDYFYKLLHTNHKILFMSATPRIYDNDNNDDDLYEQFNEYNSSVNESYQEEEEDNYNQDNEIHSYQEHSIKDDYDESDYNQSESDFDIESINESEHINESCIESINDNESINERINYRKLFGDICYTLTFNEALNKNLVCDYKLILPLVSENHNEYVEAIREEIKFDVINNDLEKKCNFLLNGILKYGLQKTIVYLKNVKEIKSFIEIFNKQSQYHGEDIRIDSITSKLCQRERNRLLKEFEEENDKRFVLCSIRILNECIDIPSCDSVFITTAMNNKVTTIQRLNRCTRKFGKKQFGYVLMWCDEFKDIVKCLEELKEYDIDFSEKVKLLGSNVYREKNREKNEKDKKSCEKYVVGVKEYKFKNWKEKLEEVKMFIRENNKRPNKHSKDKEEKTIGIWLQRQSTNYKKCSYIMKEEEIRKEYENFLQEFSDYLKSNKEVWYDNLNKLKKYIIENNKRPSQHGKDKQEKNIARWLSGQQQKYKKSKSIMKEEEIRKEYEKFLHEFSEYLKSNVELWYDNLNKLKKYMIENGKRPNNNSKDKEEKSIAQWLGTQQNGYRKCNNIMKEEEIRKEYEKFLHEFSEYLKSNEQIWYDNLQKVKNYMIQNKKRPSQHSKDKEEKTIAQWLGTQQKGYRKCSYIMKEEEIRKSFYQFNQEFKLWNDLPKPELEKIQEQIPKSVINNINKFNTKFNILKEFVITNNKKPSREDKSIYTFYNAYKKHYINSTSIFQYDIKEKQEFYDFCNKYDFLRF